MSKQSVLIADDDHTIRLILSTILESQGYQVDTAERGEKCLFLALENTYDAFLVDIRMPGLSGVELCRRLRAMDRYKMTPIIVITSLDEEANLEEVFSAGASDFISKPVNPAVLASRLKNHLEKKTYYDDLVRIREYLNRYISSRTQRMVEAYSVTGLLPTPELHKVTVMFTDIRGFTEKSRTTELEELFARVSYQLGQQVDLVYQFSGYIDKFGGDGLMAIFDGDDSVVNACLCAQEIINPKHTFTGIKKFEPFPIGIGIHYGDVLIGNIGSEEHLDYSALGETINLASRLCSNADSMQIDISQSIIDEIKDNSAFTFSEPKTIKFKGFSESMSVYKLLTQ